MIQVTFSSNQDPNEISIWHTKTSRVITMNRSNQAKKSIVVAISYKDYMTKMLTQKYFWYRWLLNLFACYEQKFLFIAIGIKHFTITVQVFWRRNADSKISNSGIIQRCSGHGAKIAQHMSTNLIEMLLFDCIWEWIMNQWSIIIR